MLIIRKQLAAESQSRKAYTAIVSFDKDDTQNTNAFQVSKCMRKVQALHVPDVYVPEDE